MYIRFSRFLGLCKPEGEASSGGGLNTAETRVGDITLGGGADAPKEAASQGGPTPVAPVVVTPVAKVEDPPAKVEAPTPWTFEKFMDKVGAGFKEDDPRFNQFKPVKEFTAKVIKENEAASMSLMAVQSEVATLKAELAAASKKAPATGTTVATPAEIASIKAELQAAQAKYDTDLSEYKEMKARTTLEGNAAFQQEFTAGQVALYGAAKQTADAVQLPQDKLDAIFEKRGELGIRKAIEEAGITDPVAKQIITEKALGWEQLQVRRDALLEGKSGKKASEIAAAYEAAQAELGGVMTRKFTDELRGQLILATKEAPAKLVEAHPLFGTPYGQSLVSEAEARFQNGLDLTADEVVQNMLLAKTAPVWEKMAMETQAKNKALETQIAKLTGNLPGAAGSADSSNRMVTPSTPQFSGAERTGDIVLGNR